MKLNKLQRYTAYIILKAEMEEHKSSYGFCIWINELFGMGCKDYNEKVIRDNFPELWSKKPKNPYQTESKNLGCLWFAPYKSYSNRITILTQCVQELEAELF